MTTTSTATMSGGMEGRMGDDAAVREVLASQEAYDAVLLAFPFKGRPGAVPLSMVIAAARAQALEEAAKVIDRETSRGDTLWDNEAVADLADAIRTLATEPRP